MIGRPEWFKLRRYTGIGLMPTTWQGWTYMAIFLFLIIFIHAQPFVHLSSTFKTILTLGTVCVLLLDTAHIMVQMRKRK